MAMTLCVTCKKRAYDLNTGVYCSLDGKKHKLSACAKYEIDTSKKADVDYRRKNAPQTINWKVILIVAGSLMVAFLLLLMNYRQKKAERYLQESLKLAEIIQNEPFDSIKVKLKGKVYLENLTIMGIHPSRISAPRESAGFNTLIYFFEDYKKPGAYLAFKKHYIGSNDKVHLLFLVAGNDAYDINIYDILVSEKDHKTQITDFYSYSRGEWESYIQSAYLERFSYKKHISGEKGNVELLFSRADSLIEAGEMSEVVNTLNQLPPKYRNNADVMETILISTLINASDSANRFTQMADSVMNVSSSQFKSIWNYRKAIYSYSSELKKYTDAIRSIVGQDPVLDFNEFYFSDQYSMDSLAIEAKFEKFINKNDSTLFFHYKYYNYLIDNFQFEKAKAIENEINMKKTKAN